EIASKLHLSSTPVQRLKKECCEPLFLRSTLGKLCLFIRTIIIQGRRVVNPLHQFLVLRTSS
ncbi:Unknown protein, partial [Striga hermonthica]